MIKLFYRGFFPALSHLALAAALIVSGVIVLDPFPALAAEAIPTLPALLPTVVDLSSPITSVITVVGSIVGVLAMFAIRYVLKATKLSGIVKDDTIRKYVTEGLEMAVHYAVSKTTAHDWSKVDTKNAAIAVAVGYALEHVPDALSYFGFDADKLAQLVDARLTAAYPDLVMSAVQPSDEPGVS